jgi:hypothetical protein
LLESCLQTCPRYAKAHLEYSKIYSGLYSDLLNLTKSKWHLKQAEEIDPDYCDVHHQFAHVAAQEDDIFEFEERLTKSLLCPFTMTGGLPLWESYWPMALDPNRQGPMVAAAAQKRYNTFATIINTAIQEADKQAQKKKSTSPLVGWNNE